MPSQKTYFANTVEAAVALAGRELGDDALLVEAGPAPEQSRGLGAYKVVFQAPEESDFAPAAPAPLSAPFFLPAPPPAPASPAASGLGALEEELARLSVLVSQLAAGVRGNDSLPELAQLAADLSARDVPGPLVNDLMDRVERRLRLRGRLEPATPSLVKQALAAEIESRINVKASLGIQGAQRRIVAFAGPAGSGKTTTLVKLAMREGVTPRKPAAIISTDTHRISAADQLRSCAAILGLPCSIAESAPALDQALAEHRQKDLVLIDTPGFGPRDADCARQWASMLTSHDEIEVHLVLPATTKSADLTEAIAWWNIFRPSKLLFTHLDETAALGGCLAAAIQCGKPVSYLCSGQRIPEDIEPATKPAILRMLFGAARAAGAAA